MSVSKAWSDEVNNKVNTPLGHGYNAFAYLGIFSLKNKPPRTPK